MFILRDQLFQGKMYRILSMNSKSTTSFMSKVSKKYKFENITQQVVL